MIVSLMASILLCLFRSSPQPCDYWAPASHIPTGTALMGSSYNTQLQGAPFNWALWLSHTNQNDWVAAEVGQPCAESSYGITESEMLEMESALDHPGHHLASTCFLLRDFGWLWVCCFVFLFLFFSPCALWLEITLITLRTGPSTLIL